MQISYLVIPTEGRNPLLKQPVHLFIRSKRLTIHDSRLPLEAKLVLLHGACPALREHTYHSPLTTTETHTQYPSCNTYLQN